MDCRDKLPGEVLPTPLFPDGRGEIINIFLPDLECEIKSYFLPSDLDLRNIRLNKNPVECLKPQKSKENSTPGEGKADRPLGPIEPSSINPDEIKLWGLTFRGSYYIGRYASLYSSRWEGSSDYLSRIDTSDVSQNVSISQYPNLTNHILFKTSTIINYSISSTNEFIGPSSRTTGSGSDTSVSYVVIDLEMLRQVFPTNLSTLYPGTRTKTGDNISAPYFGNYANGDISFFYGSGTQVLDYVNEFNSRPSGEPNYLTVSSYSGTLTIVWSSDILPTGDEKIILLGDNGMKEDCCDCIEAMAALMEAYLEKVEKLIIESENRQIEHANQTAAQICKFFTAQLKAFDIVDDDRILRRLDELENNIWTGGSLEQLERSRE